MSDGRQSPMLGHENIPSERRHVRLNDTNFEIPASTKIAKVRAVFLKGSTYVLSQVQLLDSEGKVMFAIGRVFVNVHFRQQEANVSADEILIGFKVVYPPYKDSPIVGLALVTAKSC